MFQQRRSKVALTVVCALALSFALAVPAHAVVPAVNANAISNMPEEWDSDRILGTTTTNPGHSTEAEVWWRQGWGNSLVLDWRAYIPSGTLPEGTDRSYDTTLNAPIEPWTLGAFFVLDGSPGTVLDPNTPQLYGHATGVWVGDQLHITPSVLAYSAGRPIPPGGRFPYEGDWYLHYNFYSETQVSTRTITWKNLRVDLTPPASVRKVVAKPTSDYIGPTDIWFESAQAHVTWEDMEYDSLAGTAYYRVLVNGTVFDDQVWHLGHSSRSVTIDDLPPGENKIEIITVDRATNESVPHAVTFKSDPDFPVVEITSPGYSGQLMPKSSTFAADVTDGAGIQWVDFAIDGKSVYTDKSAPYGFTKDMAAYSNGAHTLTVKAKDMFGHQTVETRSFSLDKTVPRVSSISDSPDPFYPIIREGYKDNTTIQFFTSEGGALLLSVYDADGALFTQRSKRNIGSGWQSIVWDGLGGEGGSAQTGTFSYRVMVKDAAGNKGYSGYGYTTIRDYEIVRISPDAVRIVPR